VDNRREVAEIRKHYRRHSRGVGEVIWWFELLAFGDTPITDSTLDYVYDDSPSQTLDGVYGLNGGRSYRPAFAFPCFWIEETEDGVTGIETGRTPVQNMSFAASVEEVMLAGMTNPYEYRPHLNDAFFYDGRFYSVIRYRVRGRVQDDLALVVNGQEIYMTMDHPFDFEAPVFAKTVAPWPATFPLLP
jgi:hypothetical protein